MKWVNVIVLLSVLINIGCSSTSAPPGNISDGSASKQAALTKEYHIGVDDLMRINVWGNEELSVEVPVRPDGKISMPLIGDVQAGGRTPTASGRRGARSTSGRPQPGWCPWRSRAWRRSPE